MMNFKDTLFFITNCLTLRSYPDRIPAVREVLQSGAVNWEQLVWISSSYIVLPALYVQLRDSKLLGELPADLAGHLEHLHKTNLVRNEAIMMQVGDITNILNAHNIKPIFIKGVAHELENLYGDPGERMIGDIDFLITQNEVLRAAEILRELGYDNPDPFYPDMIKSQRHFPRLINPDLLGAVEVHWQPVSRPYSKYFSFNLIDRDKKPSEKNPGAWVQSYNHQLVQTMMNLPMFNKTLHFGRIDVKHLYDLFLLSHRTDAAEAVADFAQYRQHFNIQLKIASELFTCSPAKNYQQNKKSDRYYKRLDYLFKHPKTHSLISKVQFLLLHLQQYITLPVRAVYSKSARRTLLKRLGSRAWYVRHFRSYKSLFR